jgi:hypothetical protein
VPELKSEFLFTITLSVDALHDVGTLPLGTLHVDMLGKGTFEGPRLRGEVLPGGMDMKTLRADDGVLIFMHYTGVRHGSPEVMARIARGEIVPPTEYYLRSTPYFETACPKYDWLNRIVAVGVGRRLPDHAAYDVFQIL